MNCWLAQFSDKPCDGTLVKAHLLPARVIRRELRSRGRSFQPNHVPNDSMTWDDRVWVWACGGVMGNAGHHGMLDSSRTLRVPREALPVGLEEFAAELGLTWWLEREYGPREMAA